MVVGATAVVGATVVVGAGFRRPVVAGNRVVGVATGAWTDVDDVVGESPALWIVVVDLAFSPWEFFVVVEDVTGAVVVGATVVVVNTTGCVVGVVVPRAARVPTGWTVVVTGVDAVDAVSGELTA